MKFAACFFVALTVLSSSLNASPITLMPLGDSISAGWDGAPMAGYRQDLLNELTTQNIPVQYQGVYDPTTTGTIGASAAMTAIGQNFVTAFGGYTSSDILNNLNGNVPSVGLPTTYPFAPGNAGGYWLTGGNGTGRSALSPHIVLLMIGTNDNTSAYTTALTPAQTDANITAILNWFGTNRPTTTVLIASPPPSLVSSYEAALAPENTWLANNITPAEFPNARFVNVYDSFLNPDDSINNSLISADGVHPSDAGYQVIANDFDAAVVSAVPEPGCMAIVLVAAGIFCQRRRV